MPDGSGGLTVVVAVSGTDADRAKRLAAAVADLAGSRLDRVVIARAYTSDEFEDRLERLNFDLDDPPEADAVARRSGAVREVSERLEDALGDGTTLEIRGVVADDAGTAIVDLAAAEGADRVLVGGRRRSPAGKAVFGSTAQHVLLHADAPVTFVRD